MTDSYTVPINNGSGLDEIKILEVIEENPPTPIYWQLHSDLLGKIKSFRPSSLAAVEHFELFMRIEIDNHIESLQTDDRYDLLQFLDAVTRRCRQSFQAKIVKEKQAQIDHQRHKIYSA